MSFSLRQLEYFVALAEHLNFRAAADACGVSQPGLSSQLAALEAALGVELFERDRRGVLITPAGEALVSRAGVVLREAREFEVSARELRDPFAGEVRLGVLPTIAPFALPGVLAASRAKWPGLRWRLVEGTTEELVEQLEGGLLDVGLVALESELGALARTPLYSEPFLVALPAGHRLAGRKRVKERELARERVLLLEDGH